MAEADEAMSLLLDVDADWKLDPEDLVRSLEAMERLGPDGQARMFQSFIEFAARYPESTVPTLVDRIAAAPTGWSGRLSAAVLGEVIDSGRAEAVFRHRTPALAALGAAVRSAAETDPDLAREAIGTLAAWAGHENIAEVAAPVATWLDSALRAKEPGSFAVREARAILAGNPVEETN